MHVNSLASSAIASVYTLFLHCKLLAVLQVAAAPFLLQLAWGFTLQASAAVVSSRASGTFITEHAETLLHAYASSCTSSSWPSKLCKNVVSSWCYILMAHVQAAYADITILMQVSQAAWGPISACKLFVSWLLLNVWTDPSKRRTFWPWGPDEDVLIHEVRVCMWHSNPSKTRFHRAAGISNLCRKSSCYVNSKMRWPWSCCDCTAPCLCQHIPSGTRQRALPCNVA